MTDMDHDTNTMAFREIDGKPIRFTDKSGLVHACEGSNPHPGIRLLWTLCGHDVPANAAWHPKSGDHYEMCITCLGILNAKATGATR